jgi:hypothetical protein
MLYWQLAATDPRTVANLARAARRQEWEVSYPDAKDQVRQATDIVELVGKHLELRRAGRGYVGRCPWHDDRRPSLQVNPDRQTWKCWVCDIGGDVFSFVMKRGATSARPCRCWLIAPA